MAKFQKGEVANPQGRGVAPGPRREQRRRRRVEKQAIEQAREKIAGKIIRVLDIVERCALAGDMHAAGHWLNFGMPRPRPESPRVMIEGLDGDAETASAAVMAALSRAEISVEQAQGYLQILEARARLSFSASTVAKLSKLRELFRARGMNGLAENLSLPVIRRELEGISS